jgi:solute carrier family 25 carnitine/acylcarnitine transporter 20/29
MGQYSVADPAPLPVVAVSSPMLKLAKDIFAGTMGGISVTLVGHPFDTLKVRLQTQPVDKPIYCEPIMPPAMLSNRCMEAVF